MLVDIFDSLWCHFSSIFSVAMNVSFHHLSWHLHVYYLWPVDTIWVNELELMVGNWRSFHANLLPELILIHSQLDPWEQTAMKRESKSIQELTLLILETGFQALEVSPRLADALAAKGLRTSACMVLVVQDRQHISHFQSYVHLLASSQIPGPSHRVGNFVSTSMC